MKSNTRDYRARLFGFKNRFAVIVFFLQVTEETFSLMHNLQNLLKSHLQFFIVSLSAWQPTLRQQNLDSPYFTDNLNTPYNMSKNIHTKLFKLQFSGASGNESV